MSNQIVISSGAKVRSLEGVLTGTAGIVSSVPYGGANGVATLDSSGKVPLSQLPSSVITYLGTWNASTNTPTLTNGVGDDGDLYICNVAGTVNFGAGPITFAVGDWVIYGSGTWQKSAGASGTVTSVAVTESGDALTITGSPITTSGTINIGFAGTSGQYVNGAGGLTTFPSLTGFVPYTGATANLDLGTFDLTTDIATLNQVKAVGSGGLSFNSNSGTQVALMGGGGGAGTTFYGGIIGTSASFATSGGSDTFAINHSSGSGIALNITKGGNGEGLYINKTSGSGNAATIIGTLNATTLVKNGGTSSQYLMADGSVSTGPDLTGYVPYTGATTNVDLGSRDLLTRRLYLNTNNQGIYARDSAGTNLYQIFALNSSDKVSIDQTGLGTVFGGNVNLGTYSLTAAGVEANSFNAVGSGSQGGYIYLKQGSTPYAALGGSNGISAIGTKYLFIADAGSGNSKIGLFELGSLTNNTARTYTLPDISGTLALLEGTQTFTGLKSFDAALNLKVGAGAGGTGYIGLGSMTDNTLVVYNTTSGTTYSQSLAFPTGAGNTYTFPNASGTIALTSNLSSYVPYTGATADVDLGTRYFKATGVQTESAFALKILTAGIAFQNGYSVMSSLAGTFSITQAVSAGNLKSMTFDFSAWATNSSYTYTLPAANGTLALTSDLGNYVTLDTTQTITGAKTFTTGVTKFRDVYVEGSGTSASGVNLKQSSGGIAYAGAGYMTINAFGTKQIGILDGATQTNAYISLNSITSGISRTYTLPDGNGTLVLGTGTTNYLPKFTGASTLGDSVIQEVSGNIGIGGSPSGSYKFQVTGTGNFTGALRTASTFTSGDTIQLGLASTDGGFWTWGGSNSYLVAATGKALNLNPNGVSGNVGIVIATSGNVGFGTGSPTGIGGGYTTLDIVGSNGGGFLFGRTSNKSFIYADNGGGYFGTETAVPLIFYTNTTEKMRITSGGYVCINTSNVIDDGLISIAADANLHQGIVIRNTNASSNIYYIYFKNSSNAAAGRIEQTGATSVSYASGSDYRLKEDLKDFDGLNKVLSIKTYDFKWKDEDRRDYGVLAHELQEVVSGAVLGQKDELEEDGTIKTQMVDYSKLVPVLVKAIQELSAKVSALENKS